MIRVLLVDDHPVIASGLAARYGSGNGFRVAGTAGTLAEALGIAAKGGVDVAVVDVMMDVPLAPADMGDLCAHARVVLFTARSSEPLVASLVAAGAWGVVDKSAPLEVLDAAVRAAHEGRAAPAEAPSRSARTLLSPREFEVFRALASCQTPKEVASTLGIAPSTVYCHVDNIRRKLGVQTLQEIVARAFRETG